MLRSLGGMSAVSIPSGQTPGSHTHTHVKRHRYPTGVWINLSITAAYRPLIHVCRVQTHTHVHTHTHTQSYTVFMPVIGEKKNTIPKSLFPFLNSLWEEEEGGVEREKTFALLVPETTSKW